MDNTTFVGLSRQMTLRRELDIVANNIANADTAGFKVESLMNAVEERRPAKDAQAPHAVRFVLDHAVARDFTQGPVRKTDNPLDVALEGDGFLTVGTETGDRYTRDGRLSMDPQGRLVTKAGDPVLGEGGAELVLRPTGGPVSIAADGTVSQGATPVGKIAVVRFENLSALSKEGSGRYAADGVEPLPAPDVQLRQGMVEGSNAQPVLEVVKLIELSRAYERMTRIIDQSQDLSRRAVERLGRSS
ncbi:MAG: flagellar basal-body rod protein FlgF [Pseudomonadota bacterium]|nr:flagellar basal-body rod protein FlgF [Pseudomonadota bacterium]